MDTEASPVGDVKITYRRPGFLSHVGESFLSGAALGSAVQSVWVYHRSASASAPAGRKLAAAGLAAVKNAPRVGGFIAAYSALFYVLEGTVTLARRRHDCWNSAAASAVALGLLNVHLGVPAVAVSTLVGAAGGAILNAANHTTIREETPLSSISNDHK